MSALAETNVVPAEDIPWEPTLMDPADLLADIIRTYGAVYTVAALGEAINRVARERLADMEA